jgi:hypothetical protein
LAIIFKKSSHWSQIFVLVIVFGLFNGLVFLPVLLGLFGPRQHNHEPLPDAKAVTKDKKLSGEIGAEAVEMKSLVV